jgi:hypothetical protein
VTDGSVSVDEAGDLHVQEEVVMALTMWTDSTTGKRLDGRQLSELRERAHRLYEANTHIFEDELDALAALGVQSLARAA